MAYTGSSIVDYLKSIGEDSSYAARAKKAASLGITGYTGTAAQNTQMLNMLRSSANPATTIQTGAPVKPITQESSATTTPGAGNNKTVYNSTVGNAGGSTLNTVDKKSAADAAFDNISPERKAVNDLVQSLLSGINSAPYNPSADTSYQMAVADMVKQANNAYNNNVAGYLGNQSGNFNSAALQIASGAKNDLLGRIPLLQADFEDRYNTQQRQKQADTLSLINILLGIDEADKTAADKEFQRQIDTIGQYSNDYTAEINRRMAIDPNDRLIPYLKMAAQNKIAAQEAAKTEAGKQAYKDAMEAYKINGIVTTDEQAKILGIPKGTKTAEFSIDLMNANTSRMNAQTAKTNAEKKDEPKPIFDGEDYYKTAYDMKNETVEVPDPNNEWGTIKKPKYTANDIIGYVVNSGLDADIINQILTRLNYTDSDVRAYYNSQKKAYMGDFKSLN